MYRRILVAIDGSDVAARALQHGLALAGVLGSTVTIVHVAGMTSPPIDVHAAAAGARLPRLSVVPEDMQASSNRLLERAKEVAATAGIEAKTLLVEYRRPAEGIVEAAILESAELIVMGTNGRRGLSQMVLGSQTNTVLQHTNVPVLVTR
ncbi:universal stress protein [Devosia sp. ZB163]|uniref:universal stress protein n=1 Tax=Devosia sp. ZB163 TaxID=3025938 RepID=UPI002362BAC5|nr:universal stress protein [Devosia sp. ZB163]MDC9823302.1 universal stress protein [Devosia sp. ZB163]